MTTNAVVFGASGLVGNFLVKYALERGLRVTAVTRASSAAAASALEQQHAGNANLILLQGDVARDAAFVDKCLEGQHVVLSSLGNRLPGLGYWNKVEDEEFLTLAAGNIIASMKKHGVKKIALVSSLGVNDSWNDLPLPIRGFFSVTAMGHIFTLLGQMENKFEAEKQDGQVDFCFVRPPQLTNEPLGETKLEVYDNATGGGRRAGKTSRSDVARWMVEETVKDGSFQHHYVVFADKPQ